MKNLTKLALGAASLLGMATAAMADDAAPAAPAGNFGPDFTVSAAAMVQNDYRFRGISQNAKYPSPEGTINITGPEGFYVGTWAAKIDWTGANTPSVEVDEYVGKHTDLWGTDLNVEAYYYSYPDAENLAKFVGKKASYLEIITQLSHTFDALALTATYAYSPEFSLGGGTGNYLEGTAAYTVTDWLSISGNFGHQWVQNAKLTPGAGDGDYSHADIGATFTYKALSFDARYVTTDMNAATCSFYMFAQANHPCSGGFVGTLTYNISAFPW